MVGHGDSELSGLVSCHRYCDTVTAIAVPPIETLESEVAKKDPDLRTKYYQSVREHTLAMVHKAEEAMQQLKGLGDDFSAVFEKTSKRHSALLNKVVKRVERDQKKLEDTAKAALKKAKKATQAKAKDVKKTQPVTAKAKPPAAKKPSPPSQPEILQ